MLKLGIVGTGRLGSFHAEKASKHQGVELVGITDPDKLRRNEIAQRFGVMSFEHLSELLPRVHAVVIAAPTRYHHALGIKCLNAGVHVLMEKPLAVSQREAQELVECAKNNHVLLQVGHVEQYNPAWSSAHPILQAVKRGNRSMIFAERTSGYTFRSTDIGVVHDLMIHDLDLILSVVPSPIVSINAFGFHVIGDPDQGGHEDIAWAQILFENGSVAQIHASRVDGEAKRCMKIRTAFQSARIDFATRETQIMQADESVVQGCFSPNGLERSHGAQSENAGKFDVSKIAATFMNDHFRTVKVSQEAVDALTLELNDFIHAVQSGQVPVVSGARALRAVEVADKIVQKIAENVGQSKIGEFSDNFAA